MGIVFYLLRGMAEVVSTCYSIQKMKSVLYSSRRAQLLFRLLIRHNDEFPRLESPRTWPDGAFQESCRWYRRDRVGLELAHAVARLHEVEEYVVGRVVSGFKSISRCDRLCRV